MLHVHNIHKPWADSLLTHSRLKHLLVSKSLQSIIPYLSQVFEIIRGLRDPEHPTLSLEQLRVVTAEQIRVSKGIDGITKIDVEFTPTIPTCSVATLIGLTIRTKLQKCVCGANGDIKINVNIKEGTHDQEEQVNKQLNDKERCQAAIENPNLQKVIRQGIFESDPPLPDDLQLIPVS
ncbi:Mitotic spindle-associated MMXD complex subunit MIP18 [Perkinsus olseni]|uniref:Mitotic spindle-associated MMXD complex subunit MIP18 n=1 Tax=Perkinsus olseni TaxID=32597 RepID=A0A7J6N9T7_PEROL|nr:Mitotic spindle-associated MMXD complex subunit MIP18 [Perkinsus olseni]